MFPEKIEIEAYADKWYPYERQYEHEKGGCYYRIAEGNSIDFVVDSFVSLYPDGHLSYLWNGTEHDWNKKWREERSYELG